MAPSEENASSNNENNEQVSTVANNRSSGASRGEQRARNNGNNPRKDINKIETEDRAFLGKTKEIEAVLGLKTERLTYKVTFDTFREKLAEYTLTNFTSARHVIPLIEEMENPMIDFTRNNKPKVKRKRKDDDERIEKKVKSDIGAIAKISDDDEFDDNDDDTYYDPDDYVEK